MMVLLLSFVGLGFSFSLVQLGTAFEPWRFGDYFTSLMKIFSSCWRTHLRTQSVRRSFKPDRHLRLLLNSGSLWHQLRKPFQLAACRSSLMEPIAHSMSGCSCSAPSALLSWSIYWPKPSWQETFWLQRGIHRDYYGICSQNVSQTHSADFCVLIVLHLFPALEY